MTKDYTTIYKDGIHMIWQKCWHIHKIGRRVHKDFCQDYGDIPAVTIRPSVVMSEKDVLPVDNQRGLAYGLRNAKRFRDKKAYKRCRERYWANHQSY